ncbi:peptidoglycan-binding protein [Bacillus phage Mater]|uniref:Peptidoglycan-binding protein n=1 Tax=Bacillus phage Mater TaxID=1540090 RepID=A0A0A0RMW1_9CAUD|nr:L-alanyl-D-glutamate peptidase [Bacillus phage Mater]AIW03327.1 peptidoglycan-binding protein [Bacillus phage Mater]
MSIKKFVITSSLGLGLLFAGQATASAAENNSIVDYLYQKGEDYSFTHRSELAANHGISGYKGTAYQNIDLLGKLKGGNVQEPAQVNATPAPVQKQTPVVQKAEQPATPSGRTMTVNATAYGADCAGCSGITATGLNVKANPGAKIIAADPNVIPLGSKVYLEGYGTYTVADTGGAIKGNRIDVFMGTEANAMSFGRKQLKLTILN